MINAMVTFMKDEAGALPIWTLTVLITGLAATFILAPQTEHQSTLEEGLGPVVEIRSLHL